MALVARAWPIIGMMVPRVRWSALLNDRLLLVFVISLRFLGILDNVMDDDAEELGQSVDSHHVLVSLVGAVTVALQ